MIQEIAVTDLLLDLKNYRLNDPTDQDDALHQIVQDQKGKLVKLGADVARWGTNPSELSIVMEADEAGKYIVLEGNRRLTAIRLLTNPLEIEKIDDLDIKEQFKKIRQDYPQRQITQISCVIVKSRDEADHWIELRHTGENAGVGTVRWNAQASSRFSERLGKPKANSIATQVIENLQQSALISNETKANLKNVKLTNLSRLVTDKEFRDGVGIKVKNGKVNIDLTQPEVRTILEKIINDVAAPDFNVIDIYNKTDRSNYLKSLKQPTPNPTPNPNPNPTPNPNPNPSPNPNPNPTPNPNPNPSPNPNPNPSPNPNPNPSPTPGRPNPLSSARANLIPTGTTMTIAHPRLNKIYHELRTLKVDDAPNSVAVMLRVFLELSIDEFCQNKTVHAYSKQSDLHIKITSVADYMAAQNLLSADQLKGIRVAANKADQHSMFSTHTLNAYVHNPNMAPIPSELKIAWDRIEDFVVKLWQ